MCEVGFLTCPRESQLLAPLRLAVPDQSEEPLPTRSIPDTRVTAHSEHIGNTVGPEQFSIGSNSRHLASK